MALLRRRRQGVDLTRERHKHRLDMFVMRRHVKKMETLSVSVACRVTILIGAILLPVVLTSCGKKGQDGGTVAGEEKTAHGNEGDFLDKDAKPDERKYLVAAKPFFIAIANQQYAQAYALLSSYAKARMSLNQFTPAEERTEFARNESNPLTNVTAEQFADLMKMVEAAHSTPRAPKMLHVFSSDADVLNRRSAEQFGAVDSMFAIGAMPNPIPADIRPPSWRGQIHTNPHPKNLETRAK